MKEIKKLNELDNYLNYSWHKMIPSYYYLNIWDLFDIEYYIFNQIENIIGRKKIILYERD